MIPRRLPVAVALAAGLAVGGCGTSGSGDAGPAQAKHTVQAALSALAAGDGRAFCALATPGEQARLARALARPSCPAAMHAAGVALTPAHRAALRHVEAQVTVRGATATVSAADIATPSDPGRGFLNDDGKPTRLVRRRNGGWLIGG